METRIFTREQTAAWAALREMCTLEDVREMVRQDEEAGDGSVYPARPRPFRVYPDPCTSEVSAEHGTLAEAMQEVPHEGHEIMRDGRRYAVADGNRWELTGNGRAEARR